MNLTPKLRTRHLLMSRKKKFPWPHHIDEETKSVSVYVASGYPTVMIVPKKVEEYFPGYKSRLVSQEGLEELTNK